MRLLSVCGKALFFIFPVGAGHPFRHGTLLQGFLQGEEGAEASNHSANEALVPHTLQLLGVALGRSVKASPDTSLVIVTLLGLPFVLTILAFFILGRLSEEKPPYPQRGAAMAGGDARFPPRSVPGSAFPSRPGTAGGLRPHGGFPMNGETSVPPTLPVLTSSRSLPMRQSPDLIDEDTRQSPLTMALFVKNPQGVAVRLDGTLSPTPENRTVNVVRVKDNSVILSAKVAENADSSTISLMVPSKDGQAEVIAMLDTRDALLSPNGVSRSIKRQVALHRVDVYGPHEETCAWIMPAAGPGTFFVYYSPMDGIQRPDPAMTIFTKGTEVDRITESQGNVIAASDSTAAAVAPRGHRGGLWVKEGTDMALVTCLALAVQKLGSAWTSRMLVGRPRAVCGPC